MKNKTSLYLGLLLVAVGGTFMAIRLLGWLTGASGWRVLWPLILLDVALGFLLPLIVWRGRSSIAGLAVPGSLLAVTGLILLFQSVTGAWRSWAYLWTLEPMTLGAAFVYMSRVGVGSGRLMDVGLWFMGVSAVALMLMISLAGGCISFVGPLMLIATGLALLLRGRARRYPEE